MGICSNKEYKPKAQIDDQNNGTDAVNSQSQIVFQQYKFNQITFQQNALPLPQAVGTGSIADKIVAPITTRQLKEYDDALKVQNGSKSAVYQDSSFKATNKSVSNTPTYKGLNNCVWKRSKDFLNGPPVIFDKIEPCDIQQGYLGDCYLLSSLSVLAEQPDLIKKLFITQTYQTNGLHGVYLCHDGEFIQIALDDQFPCKSDGGPIFSQCIGDEMWVLFLEKAYAKIYGAYDKIEEGWAGQALGDLTGASYETYNRDEKSSTPAAQCWDFVYTNYQKNYLMAASSQQTTNAQESENASGIISQHCYAILQAQQVVGSDGKKENILQLRNPWGRKEWTGDWGDKSNKWTPELIQKFKIVDENTGTFWMSVGDFVTEFGEVCASKVHPDYLYNSIRLQDTPLTETISSRVIVMRVLKQTHAFISLHQKDKRAYAQTDIDYDYSNSSMIIGLIDPKTNQISTYIGDVTNQDREINIESKFEPGDYAIYIETVWSQNIARDMVVSCYSESSVQFSEPQINTVDTVRILDGFIRLHKDASDEECTYTENVPIKSLYGSLAGYYFVLYTNDSGSTTLTERVKMTDLKNIEICSPFKNSDCFEVTVGPKSTQLVKYRITAQGYKDSYNYAPSSQSKLVHE